MYSKPKLNQEEAFHIPENYSGNAFQDDSTTPSIPVERPAEKPAVILDGTAQSQDATDDALAVFSPNGGKAERILKKTSPFSSFLPPRLTGSHGGLLGDIGVEELLIIGILILLSQSETDDDILLLLMLLLFYK